MYRTNKLSLVQVTVLCSSTMIGSGILIIPHSSASSGYPDGWITILIQGVFFAFIAFLFGWISEMQVPHTVYELNIKGAGKILGTTFNCYFIAYLLAIVGFEVRILGEVVQFFLLQDTPMFIIIIIFLLVAIYHLKSGIMPVIKLIMYIYPLTICIYIGLMIFSFSIFDFQNLQPIMEGGLTDFKLFTHTNIQFTGFEVVLFILPLVYKEKLSGAKWAAAIGVCITTLIYSLTLFVVMGSMTVGETKSLAWPTVSLIQTLEIEGVFIERLDIFLLVLWTCQQFICMLGFFQFAIRGCNNLFKSPELKKLLWILFLTTFALSLFPKDIDEVIYFSTILGYAMFVSLGIPFISVLLLKIKRKMK
ncbi:MULTISPECIES: GerAB/ArcD/ProY family transporter [Bacillus]|uniref:GerAB/ArcD/ProY family transporter n=1 Tax=Bacillus TaxID=1386 RepID=UPI0011A5C889|nr:MULTISPECIES: GerAB/ArcD/ProY family transporter [Bacillus]MBU8728325.1 spore germination protein [Bacillus pumilus]MCP1149862.1 spore germination protein [Bacillus sp. 1735sda2]